MDEATKKLYQGVHQAICNTKIQMGRACNCLYGTIRSLLAELEQVEAERKADRKILTDKIIECGKLFDGNVALIQFVKIVRHNDYWTEYQALPASLRERIER